MKLVERKFKHEDLFFPTDGCLTSRGRHHHLTSRGRHHHFILCYSQLKRAFDLPDCCEGTVYLSLHDRAAKDRHEVIWNGRTLQFKDVRTMGVSDEDLNRLVKRAIKKHGRVYCECWYEEP